MARVAKGKAGGVQMKKLIFVLLISQVIAARGAVAQDAAESKTEKGERHKFVIANFKTESGVVLPEARVVYGTYGHLNAAKDNAVLLPSHYMATFHGYEWLIGADMRSIRRSIFLWRRNCSGTGIRLRRAIHLSRFTGRASRSPRFATTSRRCTACSQRS